MFKNLLMKKQLFLLVNLFLTINTYSQTPIQIINGEANNDNFGYSVALSSDGNIMVVGAVDGSADDSGNVKVYQKNMAGTGWTQLLNTIDGENTNDNFGFSVAISGNGTTIAIGAHYNDNNGNTDSGHVRIYRNFNATNWSLIGEIEGQNGGDRLGYSVALSNNGNIVAIGATGSRSSYVEVYQYSPIDEIWTPHGSRIGVGVDYSFFGDNVSLSADGKIMAVSVPGINALNPNGYVRIYKYQQNSASWIQLGDDIFQYTSDPFNIRKIDVSLSSDGDIVAIGSNRQNNLIKAGFVQIYRYDNVFNTWVQLGDDIYGDGLTNDFGHCISLSANGKRMVVGDASNGTVKLYYYDAVNTTWSQVGNTIDGIEGTYSFSNNVVLSGDGTTIAFGEPYNFGDNKGLVNTYDVSNFLNSNEYVLENLSFYPNPATDRVYIESKKSQKIERVNVYDVTGRLILETHESTVDVLTLARGHYYFKVFTDKGEAVQKIAVK